MTNNVYADQADALEMRRLRAEGRCTLCGGGEPGSHQCRCVAYEPPTCRESRCSVATLSDELRDLSLSYDAQSITCRMLYSAAAELERYHSLGATVSAQPSLLAAKVVAWDDARHRFVDCGFMSDAHEADRLGAEIVADAKRILSSSDHVVKP